MSENEEKQKEIIDKAAEMLAELFISQLDSTDKDIKITNQNEE